MFKLIFRRSFSVSSQLKNLVEEDSKLPRLLSHVYRKTWNRDELIKYIKDNVVFESERFIVTSLPQGIPLKRTSVWADSVTQLVCDTDLTEIEKNLGPVFNSERLFLTVYPKSIASGLTIFTRSFEDKSYLKKTIKSEQDDYNYNFLAVVHGCPPQTFTKNFAVEVEKVNDKYYTKILQKWKNSKKIRTVTYRHKVLATSPLASLVKVEMSQDVRGCVRHILADVCSTPILGDIWNCVKKSTSFLGSPLLLDKTMLNTESVSLDPELLAKLNLQPGDENLIPIHTHLYSLHAYIHSKREIFVSVPPPESFVWTCKQLGFDIIENYQEIQRTSFIFR